MAHVAFETPPLDLAGTITANVFEEGVAPTRVIRTDHDWRVEIDWELTGSAAPMIGGEWHVHVRLESMGPGGELSLFDPDCSLTLPSADNKYSCHFEVSAGTVAAAHDGTPYRLIVTLTYRTPLGAPGPIAAYADLGIYQFFNPGP